MLEVCDSLQERVHYKKNVVFQHLLKLYEKYYTDVFGKLNGALRMMVFLQSFNEVIYMSQEKYIDDYYERIIRNAV